MILNNVDGNHKYDNGVDDEGNRSDEDDAKKRNDDDYDAS
jgi:hypothetical protein